MSNVKVVLQYGSPFIGGRLFKLATANHSAKLCLWELNEVYGYFAISRVFGEGRELGPAEIDSIVGACSKRLPEITREDVIAAIQAAHSPDYVQPEPLEIETRHQNSCG